MTYASVVVIGNLYSSHSREIFRGAEGLSKDRQTKIHRQTLMQEDGKGRGHSHGYTSIHTCIPT